MNYNLISLPLLVLGFVLLIVQLFYIKTKKYKNTFLMGLLAMIFILIGITVHGYSMKVEKDKGKDKIKDKIKEVLSTINPARAWHGLTDGDGETTGLGWVV